MARAFLSDENLEMTLGAKNEKNVAVKYMSPNAIAPNDSISETFPKSLLYMGTTKFCTVFEPILVVQRK